MPNQRLKVEQCSRRPVLGSEYRGEAVFTSMFKKEVPLQLEQSRRGKGQKVVRSRGSVCHWKDFGFHSGGGGEVSSRGSKPELTLFSFNMKR